MIFTKRLLIFYLAFILAIFCASAVQAATAIAAPDKVARGDAFLARAQSDREGQNFIFSWRGKNYSAKGTPIILANGQRGSAAEILLPAPLDEKAKVLTLGAGEARDGKAIALVNTEISLYDKKRPVQKLTVDKKYVDPPAHEKERIKRDREKVRAVLSQYSTGKEWTLPLQRPVPGSVSSQFGMKRVFNGQPRSVHRGLDLRGASGTPIKACADGEVVLVDNLYFSGNTVYVNHGEGVFSAYLHMSEPKVQVGQKVKRGDLVGLVGATGRVTGPHLHLSLLAQGQSVDPLPLLENLPAEAKNK